MNTIKHAKLPPQSKLSPGAKWFLKEIDEPPFLSDEIPIAATIYTKDGRMLCGLNPKWDTWTEELQNEVLCHESGHVSGGHDVRKMDRENHELWNVVCDAAIHHSGGVEEWAIKELDGITYDILQIPPVPPEIGYDMLIKDMPPPSEGCGRHKGGAGDGQPMSPEAKTRAIVASIRGAAEMGGLKGNTSSGSTRPIPEVIPNLPDWMIDLLTRLKKAVAYDEPVRRWIKETRLDIDPIMMPGKAPKLGVACLFVWDLSGSIGAEEVGRFLGAVDATPELAGSQIVAFSDGVAGPRPVREARLLIDECPSGGTRFHVGASKRISGVPTVWITDGYTGDGWPEPHDADEFWVINTDVQPPHGIRIQS